MINYEMLMFTVMLVGYAVASIVSTGYVKYEVSKKQLIGCAILAVLTIIIMSMAQITI